MFSAFFGLVGALLGQRFSAWSLLPTTMLALLCTAGVGAAEGARVLSIRRNVRGLHSTSVWLCSWDLRD